MRYRAAAYHPGNSLGGGRGGVVKPSASEVKRARAVMRRLGGYARAKSLTSARRSEIARNAAYAKALKYKDNKGS